jgi:hypothetical protein
MVISACDSFFPNAGILPFPLLMICWVVYWFGLHRFIKVWCVQAFPPPLGAVLTVACRTIVVE